MQVAAVEANKTSDNVILLSDTGSGKTIGFLLPMLELLDPANTNTQAVVIVPSRELALQIEQVFKKMGTAFKVTCCYGGHLRETEENNLCSRPLCLSEHQAAWLIISAGETLPPHSIETLVLDEFDKSLELGFQEEISFIIGKLPAIKKRILTSATDAVAIPDFIKMENPARLNFTGSGQQETEKLWVKIVKSDNKDKADTLFR